MMSKGFLSGAERERLSTYPNDLSSQDIGRFFTLTKQDLERVAQQRGDHNRLGFALQLCTLRYLGFLPDNLSDPPQPIVRLLAYQLEVSIAALAGYGEREQTRSDHLRQVMRHLGYRRAAAQDLHDLEDWLVARALEHDRPTFLLHVAAERLRWERILRPGLTSLERIVSSARQRARHVTFEQVSHLLSSPGHPFFDDLLVADQNGPRTTLSWLQRMPNDHTALQIRTTLEKIRFLQEACIPDWDLAAVNPNRLKYLANIGARATNQQMQRTSQLRRYPILIAFLKQTLFDLTDAAIDLFDACLWQKHVEAKAELDKMRLQAARSTNDKLRTFNAIVKIIVDGQVPDSAVRATIFQRFKSDHLQQVVQETEHLIRPKHDEAIDLFAKRYNYIRRFAPQFLSTLTFHSNDKEDPLLEAVAILKALNASGKRAVPADAPTAFIAEAWWDYVVEKNDKANRRYYELAVLWELRLALRSGDVFAEHARRYADPNTYLIPLEAWPEQRQEVLRLTLTPSSAETRLQERESELQTLAEPVESLLTDKDSWLRKEKGKWILIPFEGEDRPESAQALEDALAQRLPRLDLTDLLIEVEQWTHLSRHFKHASTGSASQNEQELKDLFASLLAQGCNFSLAQMSRSSGMAHHRLVYASTWFLREATLKQANTSLVDYHHALDVSRLWGTGTLSSSDGQRFPVAGKNLKARLIRRYFGYRRGVTFYTWTSDQFSLYGGKAIAATVRDATYVLDEILANETELPILEHTTDTSGYTEIVFALFDLLGLSFTPRIKDLQDQQLYRTDALDLKDYPLVRARLYKRVNKKLVIEMWDEMLRLAGSLKLGWVTASLVIQKLQASSRKSRLARALQEYGRLIKTLHALSWYESEEKRRWANRQLNKGEAVHALKAHVSVGNRGVLRRKTAEGLQHQVGCLNLLTNAIILWNSVYMGEALSQLELEGQEVNPEDLQHIWPTRFEHINVYGKYEFNLEAAQQRDGLRPLRSPEALNP